MTDRDVVFQLRLSKAERSALQALADRRGLTASDFIRQTIREQHQEMLGGAKEK